MNILTSPEFLGSVAVLIGLIGYMFYVRGIVQGKVKPHAFTWSVWGILTAIAWAAQVADGGGPGAWVTGFTALCSFGFAAVGLGATSRQYIDKKDWMFLISALITIPIWYLSGSPLLSVIIITVIDAVAFAPTFRKAYFHPATENGTTYMLSGTKFVFGIFALESITVVTALYPASLVLANIAFVIMLTLRRRALSKVGT